MKRIISIILAVVFLTFFGCSASNVNKVMSTTDASQVVSNSLSTGTTNQEVIINDSQQTKNYNDKTVKEPSSQAGKTTKKAEVSSKSYTTTKAKAKDSVTCSIEISCKTLLKNKQNVNPGKLNFIPTDGLILKKTSVTVKKGSTVFDVLKKACSENQCSEKCKYCEKSGIQLEYSYTPGYDSYYVEGIHQIYEKDCGTFSGWMYSVNNKFQNYGCSSCTVNEGDYIKWQYTCNLGEDIEA